MDIIPPHLTLNQVKRFTGNLDMAAEPVLSMRALDTDSAVRCMQAYRRRTAAKTQADRNEVFKSIGQLIIRRIRDPHVGVNFTHGYTHDCTYMYDVHTDI